MEYAVARLRVEAALTALDDIRPGSLSVQNRSWGGQYCRLSYPHRGKGHTEYGGSDGLGEVQRQVADYRCFRELAGEWVDLATQLRKPETRSDTGPAT